MKKILFGIAMILFAILLFFVHVSVSSGAVRFDDIEFYVFAVGLAGLVLAGIGAFKKDP